MSNFDKIDFSQNGEQKVILDYFRNNYKGSFLDIGANDGMTLSNTRALMLKGWNGVMVEPSPSVFPLLKKNCEGYNVLCKNVAIGTKSGKVTLHESDSHLVKGSKNNLALLSTTKREEIDRWKGTQVFTPVEVEMITYKELLEINFEDLHFDFISIDAEGLDVDILRQIDLSKTQMVCIEWNSKPEVRKEITNYCNSFGLYLKHQNAENLILAK